MMEKTCQGELMIFRQPFYNLTYSQHYSNLFEFYIEKNFQMKSKAKTYKAPPAPVNLLAQLKGLS